MPSLPIHQASLYRQPLDCFPCLIEEVKQSCATHSLSELSSVRHSIINSGYFKDTEVYVLCSSISPHDLNSCSDALVAFLSVFLPVGAVLPLKNGITSFPRSSLKSK